MPTSILLVLMIKLGPRCYAMESGQWLYILTLKIKFVIENKTWSEKGNIGI